MTKNARIYAIINKNASEQIIIKESFYISSVYSYEKDMGIHSESGEKVVQEVFCYTWQKMQEEGKTSTTGKV